MKTFNEYINNYQNYNNQFKLLTESQIFEYYGAEIDSVLHKLTVYTNNQINNRVDENTNDRLYTFTENESEAINHVLLSVSNDYRQALLEELDLHEKFLNDEITIEEALNEGVLSDTVSNLWNKGKENVKNAVETIKTKIKDVTEFIKAIINKTIKTVKELVEKLMVLLEKFNCTIKGLLEKTGFNADEMEDAFVNNNETIIDKIDDLKKDNIYETLGNNIKLGIITEETINQSSSNDDDENKGGFKKAIWNVFLGLIKWAGVCVVIPGIVCAAFPGTWIALLIPVACKLIWNAYSIWKIWKQFKDVQKKWKTMKKVQKVVSILTMVLSVIGIVMNVSSVIKEGAPVIKGFIEHGGKLFERAGIGIQPDVLTRGFAAIIDSIKNGKLPFGENFKESFNRISESFNQITSTAGEAVERVGKTVNDLQKEFKNSEYKSSMQADKEIIRNNAIDPSKIADGAKVTVAGDGFFDPLKNVWSRKLQELANKYGIDLQDYIVRGFNKGLNAMNSNAGAITFFDGLPAAFVKEAIKLGLMGNKGIGGIIGAEIAKTIVSNITTAAASMTAALPIIEYVPDYDGGFRVRLGSEGSGNYVYEVGPDGIKTEDFKDKDKIKSVLDKNEEYKNFLLENAKTDKDKEKINNDFKEFEDKFNKEISEVKRIVFYGKRVEEDNKKNESLYTSLYDYILEKKEYNIENPDKDTIFKNLDDLRKLIESQCPEYTKQTDISGKQIIQQADSTLAGSTQIILRSIFATKETSKTSSFEWDSEFTPDKNADAKLSIKKRATSETTEDDKFGPNDLYKLAVFLNKSYKDSSISNIYDALIDVIIIKSTLKKSSEINDAIKVAYLKMVENFSKSEIFKSKIAETWEPGKNWAPLQFNVEHEEETKEKIEELEIKIAPPEETKKEIETKVDDQLKDEDKKEDKEEDKKEDKKSADSDEEIPVLEFIPFFNAYDLADATDKGPRKEPYSFKGSFKDLEFMPIEGGIPIDDLQKLLGSLLHNMVNNCYNLIADKPCIKDGKKYKVNEYSTFKGDQPRRELGNFSNDELTDILQNPKDAGKYLVMVSTFASSKKDEENLKDLESENEKLKDPEYIDKLKEIEPDLFDDDGKLKEKEFKRFNKGLSQYQLGKNKGKKGGFFKRIIDGFKGLFGFKKDKFEQADALLHNDSTNESLYNEIFNKRLSLKDYIKLNVD